MEFEGASTNTEIVAGFEQTQAMPTPTPSSTKAVAGAFAEMLLQFLDALSDVFPECRKVVQYKLAFNVRVLACGGNQESIENVYTQAITAYHNSMSPYYARCIEGDETLLAEDIDLMRNIDMEYKYTPDLHEDTKAAIWEYIIKLNEFASIHSMYTQIPTGMLSSIENIAHNIAGKIGSGEMNLTDLNLQNLSEQVMRSINVNDIQHFAQQLAGNGNNSNNILGNVSTMYNMVSSLMKSQQM